jgi:hypothetical protein
LEDFLRAGVTLLGLVLLERYEKRVEVDDGEEMERRGWKKEEEI